MHKENLWNEKAPCKDFHLRNKKKARVYEPRGTHICGAKDNK
jgi:hypothetical protein